MTGMLYQAKAGDGMKKQGLRRMNSFFNTPQEAFSEAIALKEKMDKVYKNEIEWDYNGKITGSPEKMNILRGYLGGDRKKQPFYLQIVMVAPQKDVDTVSPIKPKTITVEDEKVLKRVVKLLK